MLISFPEAQLKSQIIKAMAHPIRLMAIKFLSNGERSFPEICENLMTNLIQKASSVPTFYLETNVTF